MKFASKWMEVSLVRQSRHFKFLMPLRQQAKKGRTMLGRMKIQTKMENLDFLSTEVVRRIMSGMQEIL